jgi:hypothetical protein
MFAAPDPTPISTEHKDGPKGYFMTLSDEGLCGCGRRRESPLNNDEGVLRRKHQP